MSPLQSHGLPRGCACVLYMHSESVRRTNSHFLNMSKWDKIRLVLLSLFIFFHSASIYYLNTNEIPVKLSRGNTIFSHVTKESPLQWMHDKFRLSLRNEMVWYLCAVM